MIIRTLQPGGWHLYRPDENPKQCRKEWNEQVDFVAWVREHWPEDAAMMFHPVNEGEISPQYRQSLIKAGLLSGVADLVFLRHGWRWPCGLIEMKRCAWSARASKSQREVLELAAMDGKFCAVANGADAAKVAFIDYKKGFDNAEPGAIVRLPLIVGGGK